MVVIQPRTSRNLLFAMSMYESVYVRMCTALSDVHYRALSLYSLAIFHQLSPQT